MIGASVPCLYAVYRLVSNIVFREAVVVVVLVFTVSCIVLHNCVLGILTNKLPRHS